MHEDGVVTEGCSSTAFIVKGDGASTRIVTRENSQKILPGCTRRALMDLAKETGIEIEERAFTLDEAYAAKEAFITKLVADFEKRYPPSRIVDKVWHMHLTYTQAYNEGLCKRTLGRPLDHTPSGGKAEERHY